MDFKSMYDCASVRDFVYRRIANPAERVSVNLSVTVNKGTQMDDFWIDKTIEAMINSSDQNLIDLGTNLLLNRDKITKLISTVNKDTKEIIIIKLDAFNG